MGGASMTESRKQLSCLNIPFQTTLKQCLKSISEATKSAKGQGVTFSSTRQFKRWEGEICDNGLEDGLELTWVKQQWWD